MTDTESVPTVGSRIGRYLILREVAQGTLGPLFIAEREVGDGVTYGLARVVALPSELQAHDEQALADAIWDSTHLTHDLVLRVADVVTGKGSLTLIHEHSEGSLLEFLQTCAKEARSAFPAKVASRVALDVIEGLEQSRDHCAAAGIPWRSGSVSPGSLLLGPDGRVRSMDGQITAAALRVAEMRQRKGLAAYAAPEMLDDTREPNERSDVFAVGVLLWELLTGRSLFEEQGSSANLGRGFKIPKVTQSVPAGTKVPQGLVHTVHTALDPDPLRRQSSLRELAVAIVMGVEDVSTYEQVLEFTDALLLPAAAPAPTPLAAVPDNVSAAAAAPMVFTVENPDATPPIAADLAIAAAAPVAPEVAQPLVFEVTGGQAPAAPIPEPQEEITAEQPTFTVEDPAANVANNSAAAAEIGGAQTDGYREKLGTLPGHGTNDKPATPAPPGSSTATAPAPAQYNEVVQSTTAKAVPAVAPSVAAPAEPPAVASPVAPPNPFKLATDEPIVPIAVKPVQVVGVSASSEPPQNKAATSSQRVAPKPTSSAPEVEIDDPAGVATVAPKRTVQLSMGTLVFGILTTVLAVIVIMLVMQRSSNKTEGATVVSTSSPATSAQLVPQPQGAPQAVATDPAVPAAPVAEAEGAAQPAAGKADRHKHGAGTPGKAGAKVLPEGETRANDSKPTEQPSKGHFVPNEL